MSNNSPVFFSQIGGLYDKPVELRLDANGLPIYYTTDGSKPTAKSPRYKSPLLLKRTTVIRASALRDKWLQEPTTHSFFIGENIKNMPVVSVVISPEILFDPERGIMVDGVKIDHSKANRPGANYWTKREFVCNTEILEEDGQVVHNSRTGFRIFGGYSRVFPQKSFVLVARKKYGAKRIKHKVFGKKGLDKFKYLVCRNAGSDWTGTHFRDEMMSELVDDWDVDKQDYRPALVYLNGKYWGIYHIREKINNRYLADHFDIDKDSIDLLEHRQTVRSGSYKHYGELLDYINRHDMADSTVYAEVQNRMDVNNFMDTQIAQIYCDNTDAGGNVRYWRPQRPHGRWRWILFDTDWGFGLHRKKAYSYNSFDFFTDPNGPEWPNPPWSTFLLRSLLENQTFREAFINRFLDRLNTDLSPEAALAVMDKFLQKLGPEMPRHLDRWGRVKADWANSVGVMREFVTLRPDYLRRFMGTKYQLGALCELQLALSPGGKVVINDNIKVNKDGFKGEYFEGLPVRLRAIPDYGYRFVAWEGLGAGKEADFVSVGLREGKILRLVARFEPYTHPLVERITFNEICAFNPESGDWVELYNRTGQAIDMSGWVLSDGKKRFKFPSVSIQPKGYLVVCHDSVSFSNTYHQVGGAPIQKVGNFRFGINKAIEHLYLYAADGGTIDTLLYSALPEETAYTSSLIYPTLDNGNPTNWQVKVGLGSPGVHNPVYLAEILTAQKDFWLRIGLGVSFFLVLFLFLWWKMRS